MKKLTLSIICFCSLLLMSCQKEETQVSNSSQNIELREKHDICMTSYNTYLLDTPSLFGIEGPQCEGEDCKRRALSICDQVTSTGNEIINLQEVWVEEAGKALEDCLKSKGYNVTWDIKSGLMTASTLKVLSSSTIIYNIDGGVDCFKDKGFQVTNYELENGCKIVGLNTHLQADKSDFPFDLIGDLLCGELFLTSSKIRASQLSQITNYIRNNNLPVYLGGDFNIRPTDPLFTTLLGLGTITNFATGSIPSATSTDGSILDYILISDVTSSTTLNSFSVASYIRTSTKYYLTVKCDDEVKKYGPFNTEQEAKAFSVDPGCVKTVTSLTTTENVNPSDHNRIDVCFSYDCESQLTNNPISDIPVDGCDPSLNKYDCIKAGGIWAESRCTCK